MRGGRKEALLSATLPGNAGGRRGVLLSPMLPGMRGGPVGGTVGRDVSGNAGWSAEGIIERDASGNVRRLLEYGSGMSPSAPTSALRQALQDRFSQIADDAEEFAARERDRGRLESADRLNQAVRRIRQAENPESLAATLADTAAGFARCAALFRMEGDTARGERLRGLSEEDAEHFRELEIPLSAAAALAGAIETRDPVTAAATPAEVSERMASLARHAPEDRVSLFPVVARDGVPALVYAWGEVQASAIELLSQVAGAVWSELEPPKTAPEPEPEPELVQIQAAAAPESAPPVTQDPRSAWERLAPEERQIHLRAQRFARVRVAEMRLREPEAVLAGRTQRDLYAALRKSIDTGRDEFRRTFFARTASMVDYFHLELLKTLANEDPEALGNEYPGPLV